MMLKFKTSAFLLALLFSMSLLAGCGAEDADQHAEKTATAKEAVSEKAVTPEKTPEPTPPPLPDDPGSIDASELSELMGEEPNLQILDVRTPDEVAQGKIKGAIEINFKDADFAAQAKKALDKSKPVAVYCQGGGRSAKAVAVLGENGFDKTYNLVGGYSQWVAEGNE